MSIDRGDLIHDLKERTIVRWVTALAEAPNPEIVGQCGYIECVSQVRQPDDQFLPISQVRFPELERSYLLAAWEFENSTWEYDP